MPWVDFMYTTKWTGGYQNLPKDLSEGILKNDVLKDSVYGTLTRE